LIFEATCVIFRNYRTGGLKRKDFQGIMMQQVNRLKGGRRKTIQTSTGMPDPSVFILAIHNSMNPFPE